MRRINVEGTGRCCRQRLRAACGGRSSPAARSPSASTASRRHSTSRQLVRARIRSAVRESSPSGRAGGARTGDATVRRAHGVSLVHFRAGRSLGRTGQQVFPGADGGKLPFKVKVGFGCLDVRDFADGMVLAAERGRSGSDTSSAARTSRRPSWSSRSPRSPACVDRGSRPRHSSSTGSSARSES